MRMGSIQGHPSVPESETDSASMEFLPEEPNAFWFWQTWPPCRWWP
jgi:hypothetical protein